MTSPIPTEFIPVFVLSILSVMLVVMFGHWVRPSLAFTLTLVLFYLLGFIPTEKLLENFTNTSLINLLMLLTAASVINKTELFGQMKRYLGKGRGNLVQTAGIFTGLSAFLNNTLLVALLIHMFQKHPRIRQLLMPLAYLVIIGGTITLVGTSTNMILNGLVIDAGLPPLPIFEFAVIGIPLAVVGMAFVLLVGKRLVPSGKNPRKIGREKFFLETRVMPDSELIGKTIKANRLRNLEYLFLAEILRGSRLISPVSPKEKIEANDILVFTGDIKNIQELQKFPGLQIFNESDPVPDKVLQRNLVWAILSHESDLVNVPIKEANFRSRFDAAVVAVKRGTEKLSGKIGLIRLEPGDELVMAVGDRFYENPAKNQHFYFLNALDVDRHLGLRHSLLAVASFVLVIAGSSLEIYPLFNGLLVLLLFYLGMRYITVAEMKASFPFDLVLLIAAALGISDVLIDTGAAKLVATHLTQLFEGSGTAGNLIAIYILTVVFTEVMTPNAAAALAFPIGFSTARALGVDPEPFIYAMVYASSACFITPFGYQVKHMIASAGGYKPKDFLRLGLPLSLVYGTTAILLLLWRYGIVEL